MNNGSLLFDIDKLNEPEGEPISFEELGVKRISTRTLGETRFAERFGIKVSTAHEIISAAVRAGILHERYVMVCPNCGRTSDLMTGEQRRNRIGKISTCPCCGMEGELHQQDLPKAYFFDSYVLPQRKPQQTNAI